MGLISLNPLWHIKANTALQPQIREIRRKYRRDRQAQKMARQALYKERGVIPLSRLLIGMILFALLGGFLVFSHFSAIGSACVWIFIFLSQDRVEVFIANIVAIGGIIGGIIRFLRRRQ